MNIVLKATTTKARLLKNKDKIMNSIERVIANNGIAECSNTQNRCDPIGINLKNIGSLSCIQGVCPNRSLEDKPSQVCQELDFPKDWAIDQINKKIVENATNGYLNKR
ncbi:unnamed protein product [Rotaria socialis]|uniref:Uncharacterized protein n=1 Tax=Rotaria socialis TaxID=392032 RepID=A0A818AAT9_9BILA|nr:unnamed protein product [Rotaria socialis]CAF3401416.1 unnamed protein product [Rotaria socialis]CAF3427691.1 unnamed protein product [Rotaria socialis]CAF3609859.1 unnamed protein product [Rotaria socialis]